MHHPLTMRVHRWQPPNFRVPISQPIWSLPVENNRLTGILGGVMFVLTACLIGFVLAMGLLG